ncbi:hypothetical protein ACFWUQ_26320 [Streptomyces sp. NPDC058662]|uniref:hypothetical protein n=1 Tax=Streptomyces sp. NPDC058662 TaxID=3346583 RepID=UPI00365F462C
MAASIISVPGTAQAADPVKPAVQGAGAPAFEPRAGAAEAFGTFTGAAAADSTRLAIFLSARMSSAHGFELTTSLSRGNPPLEATIDWGDGTTETVHVSGSSELRTTHVYKELGEYTIKAAVADPVLGTSASNEVRVKTMGSEFTPYGPSRLLDTRSGTGTARAKVGAYSSARLKVAGNGSIPAGVTAVALNVTATNTTSAGHVSVFASGTRRPTASNINYEAGRTVPNLVIARVGADGYVELYNGGWEPIDLIADATGYFTQAEASGYVPKAPIRIVDTRYGIGARRGPVAGQGSFTVKAAPGATAVALNVTVTDPREAGHLTVHPAGQAAPTTSNVNFTAGQTVANSVIVPVGGNGEITVRNGAWASSDVIVDLVGTYGTDSDGAYVAVEPVRQIDTRESWSKGPWPAREYIWQAFSAGQEAWVLNTTVTNTLGAGFLSVAPDTNTLGDYTDKTAYPPARPVSSTLNWSKGGTVANLVQASSGNFGIVDFWNQGWDSADLVVDIFGYYESE